MALNGQIPNGGPVLDVPSSQTVVGINFGNSFASIAVINKVCRQFPRHTFIKNKSLSRRDSLTVSRMKMANARSLVPSLFAVKKLRVSHISLFYPYQFFKTVHWQRGKTPSCKKQCKHYHRLPKFTRQKVRLIYYTSPSPNTTPDFPTSQKTARRPQHRSSSTQISPTHPPTKYKYYNPPQARFPPLPQRSLPEPTRQLPLKSPRRAQSLSQLNAC